MLSVVAEFPAAGSMTSPSLSLTGPAVWPPVLVCSLRRTLWIHYLHSDVHASADLNPASRALCFLPDGVLQTAEENTEE